MEVLMRTHLQHLRGAAFALALVVGSAAAATPIATAAEETTTITVKVKGPGANKMTITPYSGKRSPARRHFAPGRANHSL
jgi:hypothetical protein